MATKKVITYDAAFKNGFSVDVFLDKYDVSYASQYDVYSRQLYLAVTSNGEEFDLSGCVVWVKCVTPDGHVVPWQCDILTDVNRVYTIIPDTVLLSPGKADCQLSISDGYSTINSAHFYLNIVQSVFGTDCLAEEIQYINFENAVAKLATAETIAQEYANQAADSAAAAAISETNAATSETNANNYYLLSKSWAHGDTGVRDGEDTDNSWYWANRSGSYYSKVKEIYDAIIDIDKGEISNLPVVLSDLDGTYTEPESGNTLTYILSEFRDALSGLDITYSEVVKVFTQKVAHESPEYSI